MMKLKRFIFALVAMSACFAFTANAQVAKVGNTEYATIDEAIANWTNNTTLTLLSDVTLSDVVKLSSTEYHILDLGTYTMTAASGKDAIQYVVNGRSTAGYALDIKADATNPGGITSTGGSIVRHTKPLISAPSKDRPITRFYGGVFNASYIVRQGGTLVAGYTGASAPRFDFIGGEFNGTVYANRSIMLFKGGTFNRSIQISVDSSAYGLVSGGRFKDLSNLMGSELNSNKFTIGSAKGTYDRGIYVDKEGYYVITPAPITAVSSKYRAVMKESYNSNNYFYYSSAATYGLYYEDAAAAIKKHGEANVTLFEAVSAPAVDDVVSGDATAEEKAAVETVITEVTNNAAVKDYAPELPAEVDNFTVTLKAVEVEEGSTPEAPETTTTVVTEISYTVTPSNAAGEKVSAPTEKITFRLPLPSNWASEKVEVLHETTSIGKYNVQTQDDAKYVEVTSQSFSTYTVQAIVPVAKIGTTGYDTFAAAMTAANATSGEVTVEIYDAVEFVDGMEFNGSYTTINFVGKAAAAKMTVNQTAGGDYLEAHGKKVNFTDLTLAKANASWQSNSGHMSAYFSLQGGTATYTNCIFTNGACTSGGTATYTNCTFQNASEYGLWAYDDAIVTVNGGTIDSKKGIKVYSEDESSVTTTLTVQNTTFTENVTAKPAVAVGYAESITLIGNTYNNPTAHVELDSGTDADCEGVTFVAQNANNEDISATLKMTDRSNNSASCGVLVDGKVYTTVTEAATDVTSSSTVTVLYTTTEEVTLPIGATIVLADGVTAENVKNAEPVAEIGEDKYATLQEAINAVKEGETITLLTDVTITTPAYGQNALNHASAINFTLDLNGKTISSDTGNSVFRFNIAGSGATSDVTVTVKNGKVVSGANTWCTLMSSGISADVRAVLNLEDLIVENNKGGDLAVKAWANGVVNAKNVTVNSSYGGGFYALGGEIVLDNCIVNQKGLWTAPYLSVAVGVSNGGKLTVNSGTYSTVPAEVTDGYNQGTTHGTWCGALMSSGGTLIINGGTFSNGNINGTASNPRELFTIGADADYGDAVASHLVINDGDFCSIGDFVHCETIWGSENDAANTYMPTMAVTINGGDFADVAGKVIGGCDPVSTGNKVDVNIAGGTYNANNTIAQSYLADGYKITENEGVYTVVEKNLQFAANIENADNATQALIDELLAHEALNNYDISVPAEVKAVAITLSAVEADEVTFDVTPKNENDEKVSAPSAAITFRLPLPARWSSDMARVSHKANDAAEAEVLGTYTVQTTANGAKYVEVTSQAFSEYTVKAVQFDAEGEGSEASPFIIDSYDKLVELSESVNGGKKFAGVYFKLTSDITLTNSWTPIGNGTRSSKTYSGNAFQGIFDGDGKTISGLTITSTTADDAALGLFGVVDGGTVKNLTLTDVDINVENSDLVGGAIGMMLNGATAQNITVNGAVVGNDGVGGIVGRLVINGTIKGCINNASVTSAYGGIGGIVGKAYYEDATNTSTFASVEECINNGTVSAPMYVGGIAGLARANVTDCVNNGAVQGGTQTGGIVGQLIAAGIVSGNENKAKVSGKNHMGGIIGDYTQSSDYTYNYVLIKNNINRGELVATEQCAAIMGCNNIDGFTDITATGNISYYNADGLELFGNPEDMVIDDTNKFALPPVAKIGEVEYTTLAEAVAEANSGATIILLNGEHELPLFSDKELTFKGESKDGVIVNDAPDARTQGWNGSTFHFENLTAKGATANYYGLANGVVAVTYKDCNINGLRFLYAPTVSFEDCAFNAEGVEHSFWTYGASDITVTNCTFTYTDRAVNCYSENGAEHETDIAFTDCSFTYAGTSDTPAGAVEINSGSVKSIELTMDNCTAPTSGDMWFNSQWDSQNGENTIVEVDGVIVWQVPAVAKIGDVEYKSLQKAINAAILMSGDVTIEILAGTYAEDITLTNAAITTGDANARPNITFKAVDGQEVVLAGTVTLGYRAQGTGASMWNGKVTFNGITFNHAEDGKHSLDIQDVKGIALVNCKVIGDGEYGIGSASGNATTDATFTSCTFENGAMQVLGQLGANLVVNSCTCNDFSFNVQGGAAPGITIQNTTFNLTLTDAHVGESFYAVRSNACPINIENTKVNVDSEVSSVATDQAKWGLFFARKDASAKWNITDCEVNLTDAALAQTELLLTKNEAGEANGKERINITNLTSTSNNVADLIARTEGYALVDGANYLDGKPDYTGKVVKIGNYGYTTLAKALEAVVDGDVVTLLADIAETVTITQKKDVNFTIDGNGKTYSSTITVVGDDVPNGDNTETLTFMNVNFVPGSDSYAVQTTKGTYARNITFDGCTFSGTEGVTTYGVRVRNGYNFTFKNTTATNVACLVNASEFLAGLTVENVTVTGASVPVSAAYGLGTATFRNVNFDSAGSGIWVQNKNTNNLTFDNCIINAKTPIYIVEVTNNAVTATFNGTNDLTVKETSTTGKKFVITDNAEYTANITAVVNDANLSMENSDFAAKVGNVHYTTLQKAIDVAQDGDVVTLVNDIALGWDDCITNKDGHTVLTYVTGKDITLDMNGKKIAVEHLSTTNRIYAVVCVEDGAGLTVIGNGTINVTTDASAPKVAYMFWKRGTTGHLTISNGTFRMNNSEDSMIYTNGSEIVTVEGGNFTLDAVDTRSNGFPCIINAQGNNVQNVIVTGGTYNYDIVHQYWAFEVSIAKEKALKNNGNSTWTIVDAEAYVGEEEGNYINYVGYVTFEEAMAAASNQEIETHVTLLKNATVESAVEVAAGKAVVLDLNGKKVTAANDKVNLDINGKLTINDETGEGVSTFRNHFVHAGAEIVVNGGTIQNIATATGGFPINLTEDNAKATINGGTVQALNGEAGTGNNGNYAISVSATSSITVNGGTINGKWGGINSQGTVTITDGTFNVTDVIGGHCVFVYGGTATISGGTFTPNTGASSYSVYATGGATTITGGNFGGGASNNDCVLGTTEAATISVTGGTFAKDVTKFCAQGYICSENSDGTFGIQQFGYIDELTLVDGQLDEFVNEYEQEVGTLTYKRTLEKEGVWLALYVPFEIPVSELIDNYEVAYFNDFRETFDENGDVVEGKSVIEMVKIKSGTLKANYPYAIKAKNPEALDMEIVLNNVILYSTTGEREYVECSSATKRFTFYGTYKKGTRVDLTGSDDILVYALNYKSENMAQMSSTAMLGAFRMYMTITTKDGEPFYGSDIQPARSFSLQVIGEENEDGTTTIYDVEGTEQHTDVIFDLHGRRVLSPVKGNLYIVNGKKVAY